MSCGTFLMVLLFVLTGLHKFPYDNVQWKRLWIKGFQYQCVRYHFQFERHWIWAEDTVYKCAKWRVSNIFIHFHFRYACLYRNWWCLQMFFRTLTFMWSLQIKFSALNHRMWKVKFWWRCTVNHLSSYNKIRWSQEALTFWYTEYESMRWDFIRRGRNSLFLWLHLFEAFQQQNCYGNNFHFRNQFSGFLHLTRGRFLALVF